MIKGVKDNTINEHKTGNNYYSDEWKHKWNDKHKRT